MRQDSAGKSRFSSSILTSKEIATEKGLWNWESEGISEDTCPLQGQINDFKKKASSQQQVWLLKSRGYIL